MFSHRLALIQRPQLMYKLLIHPRNRNLSINKLVTQEFYDILSYCRTFFDIPFSMNEAVVDSIPQGVAQKTLLTFIWDVGSSNDKEKSNATHGTL